MQARLSIVYKPVHKNAAFPNSLNNATLAIVVDGKYGLGQMQPKVPRNPYCQANSLKALSRHFGTLKVLGHQQQSLNEIKVAEIEQFKNEQGTSSNKIRVRRRFLLSGCSFRIQFTGEGEREIEDAVEDLLVESLSTAA